MSPASFYPSLTLPASGEGIISTPVINGERSKEGKNRNFVDEGRLFIPSKSNNNYYKRNNSLNSVPDTIDIETFSIRDIPV